MKAQEIIPNKHMICSAISRRTTFPRVILAYYDQNVAIDVSGASEDSAFVHSLDGNANYILPLC